MKKAFAGLLALFAACGLSAEDSASVSVWSPGEGSTSLSDAANWATDANGEESYLINTDLVAQLTDGEVTFGKVFYVGRGYGQDAEGNWGLSNRYDAGATLELTGGTLNATAGLWVGAGYADYIDSVLTVDGGVVKASFLSMGDCASFNKGTQDHDKVRVINLKSGSIETTEDLKVGVYNGSKTRVHQTGGEMVIGHNLSLSSGDAAYQYDVGNLKVEKEVFLGVGVKDGAVAGSEKNEGEMTIGVDATIGAMHIGRDGGQGKLTLTGGKTTLSKYDWFAPLNVCWGGDEANPSVGEMCVQEGASLDVKGDGTVMAVGAGSYSKATLETSGLVHCASVLTVGDAKCAEGQVSVLGGTLEANAIRLASGENGIARVKIDGGCLVARDYMAVGGDLVAQWAVGANNKDGVFAGQFRSTSSQDGASTDHVHSSVALRKVGLGTWTFNGQFNAAGSVVVSEGELVLNGQIDGDPADTCAANTSPTLSVAANAILNVGPEAVIAGPLLFSPNSRLDVETEPILKHPKGTKVTLVKAHVLEGIPTLTNSRYGHSHKLQLAIELTEDGNQVLTGTVLPQVSASLSVNIIKLTLAESLASVVYYGG